MSQTREMAWRCHEDQRELRLSLMLTKPTVNRPLGMSIGETL
jgi:hypothetical protein